MHRASATRSIPAPLLLLGIVAALVLLQLLIVGGTNALAIMWLLAMGYALYITATLLVFAALVARVRGRPPLAVPLVPERWATERRTYLVLGGVVAVVTLLREGAFAPALTLNYDVYQAEHRTNTSRSSGGNATTFGKGFGEGFGDGQPDLMAGRPVHCQLHCSNPSITCEAVLEQIRCDNHRNPDAALEGAVMVGGSIGVEDPSCYFPLYKDSHSNFTAQLSLVLATARTNKAVTATIQGTLAQDATGPMSCWSYRRLAAQKIAAEIAGALQATIDAE